MNSASALDTTVFKGSEVHIGEMDCDIHDLPRVQCMTWHCVSKLMRIK